jgi:pectinesterase
MLRLATIILTAVASALALSSPPSGSITVGSGGKYSKLSDALKDTSSSVYFIYSGTYTDTAIITRSGIKIYGQTNTATSYTGNSTQTEIPL